MFVNFVKEKINKLINNKIYKKMETIDLKEVRKQFSEKDIKSNLSLCEFEILRLITNNKWRFDRNLAQNTSLSESLKIDLTNSSLSFRKRLARRIYIFLKKKNINSINLLIRTINKNSNIAIKESLLEEEINTLRRRYKEFKKLTEETRLQLKSKKQELRAYKTL